jgi:hypothetical protein
VLELSHSTEGGFVRQVPWLKAENPSRQTAVERVGQHPAAGLADGVQPDQFEEMLMSLRDVRRRFILSTAVAAVASMSGQFALADLTWDPGLTPATPSGGTGTWDNATTANWSDGSTDMLWDSSGAIFGGSAGTVTLNSPVSTTGLTLNTPGYTISGTSPNAITLTGATLNASYAATGAASTIAAPLAGTVGITK